MSDNASYIFATALVAALASTSCALAQSRSTLPSIETQSAIESLKVEPPARSGNRGGADPPIDFKYFKIDPEKMAPSSRDKMTLDNQGNASIPLLVPNTLVLQFEPDASKEAIDSLLRSRNLKVVDTFPKLGAVKVEGDLSGYFTPEPSDKNANQALLRGVTRVIEDFKKEPMVRNVTPDIALRVQSAAPTNIEAPSAILSASEINALAVANNTDVLDWGLGNIEADQLWSLPGAQDGVLFGIMDAGFGRHENITFIDLPPNTAVSDHGNHVAGIACGRHVNSHGPHGVLLNCFVRARAGDVFLRGTEGGPVPDFLLLFSQILGTMNRFFGEFDDVHVYNVSMGYNWESNFGINPDLPESADWRTRVASQGAFLVTALELANKAGKVIFSAAGNDSFGVTTPIQAKFASPMNWAAITAREMGIAKNGVVVEAHDSSNQRAPFSNVGGNISCPGVDVLSSIAHDGNGNVSQSSYGKMSGTSMASPYCASAYALLSLVRPGYSSDEILDCLVASSARSSTGVPIPKLTQALAKCPAARLTGRQ